MLRSYEKTSVADSGRPDFHRWQILLLFGILGLLSMEYPLPALFTAALLLLAVKHGNSRISFLLQAGSLLAGGFLLAWSLTPAWMSDPPNLPGPLQGKVELSAVIKDLRPKPENSLRIILDEIIVHLESGGQAAPIRGRAVWTWQNAGRWPAPGQRVRGWFRLKPIRGRQNFGVFDAQAFWARQGVRFRTFTKGQETNLTFQGPVGRSWRARLALRKHVLDGTREGPGQGLLLALLMGDRSKTSYADLDLVRRASLAHSLALSGLHVGFVVALAWGLVWLAGRARPAIFICLPRQKWIILCAVPLVLIYLWLGQARPSLIRAGLMFLFWGILLLSGRNKILGDGIFFALLVLVCLQPLSVHDVGLQLSFCAVAGIIAVMPAFLSWISRFQSGWLPLRVLVPILSLLGISCIANTVLLPLLVKQFGEWSPHLYLNLLWLPVLGCCVLPLGLLGLGLCLCPGLNFFGGLLLTCSQKIIEAMVALLHFLDAGGWLETLVPLRPLWPESLGYWILLAALILSWHRPKTLPSWIPALGLLLLLTPGIWYSLESLNNRLTLRMIDVGQGQSVLLRGPGEHTVLVDGGGSWNQEFDTGRYILSPALTWGRSPRVDTVILTHDDYDHLRGLFYILQHYRVQRFLYNGNWPRGWDGERLEEILQHRDIPVQTLSAGMSVPLGDRLHLRVLHPSQLDRPEKDNNASLVLRLCHGHRGLALLPGDIENKGLALVLPRPHSLRAEVLILPHHGSRSSFNPELYFRVAPQLALVSCGYLNHFHFPHPEICAYFEETDIPLISTARHGETILHWDLSGSERTLSTKTGPKIPLSGG